MMNLFTLGFKVSSDGFDELQGKIGGITDAVGALGAAFTSLKTVQIGKELVKEFAGAETQGMRLRAAIEGIGGNYAKLRPQIDATIDSMQRLTTIEDDAAAGALARLVATTRDVDKSMRGLKVAQEFAARGMMDLESAAVLVGKAITGNTAMLQRFGIHVDTTRDVLSQLEQSFVGVAEAQVKTLGGAMTQTDVALGNFRESLGSAINNTFGLDQKLRSLTDALRGVNGEFSPVATSFVVAVSAVGTLTVAIYGLAAAFVTLRGAITAAGGAQLLATLKDPRVIAAVATLTALMAGYSYVTQKAARAAQDFRDSLDQKTVAQLTAEKTALETEIGRLEAKRLRDLDRSGYALTGSLDKAKSQLSAYTDAIEAAALREKQAQLTTTLAAKQAAAEKADALAKLQEKEQKAFDTRLSLAKVTDLTASAIQRLADEAARYEKIAAQSNTSEQRRLDLLERAKRIRETLAEQTTTERVTLGKISQTVNVKKGYEPALSGPAEGGVAALNKSVGEQLMQTNKAQLQTTAAEFKINVDEIVSGIMDHATMRFLEMRSRLKDLVEQSLGQSLGDTVYNAFAAAFSGKGITGLFETFGRTVLSSIGKLFVMMGQYMIAASGVFKGIAKALTNPLTSGWALAAYGVALIALGAGMGALATRGADKGSTGAASVAATGGTYGGYESTSQRMLFGTSSGTVAAGMTPRENVTVNLIGKDDPRAQRELLELIAGAQRRGSL